MDMHGLVNSNKKAVLSQGIRAMPL